MQNKSWAVFCNKSKKYATIHNLTCAEIEKHGKGNGDTKSKCGYEWVDSLEESKWCANYGG